MSSHHRFEYDVALSYAKEDQPIARKLGELLSKKNFKVMYDEHGTAQLGGSSFLTHIAELYRTKAQYCLLLISKHYPLNKWTEAERSSAQQHALRDAEEYLLLIQLDDTDLPGVREAKGYYDFRQDSQEALADRLDKKLSESRPRSGPPEESHDLRSGNVR